MDAIRAIRQLGLQAKCYDGEFQIDYKRRDPRYRADTSDEAGNECYGTTCFEYSPEAALETAKAMAAWQPTKGIRG